MQAATAYSKAILEAHQLPLGKPRSPRDASGTRVAAATTAAAPPAWQSLGAAPITNAYQAKGNIFSGALGGNTSGRVTAEAVVQSGPTAGTIFVGTGGGGVWRSTDGGGTWSSTTDQVSTGLAIGALAIDPVNPSIIYAGTGEPNAGDGFYGSGILKSVDGGSTWSVLNYLNFFTGDAFSSIAVDANDDKHLLATVGLNTNHGLFESTDSGATWTTPDTAPGSGFKSGHADGLLVDAATNPSTVYVATEGVGIQKSSDGGTTFTTLAGGLPAAGNFGVTALAMGTPTAAQPAANRTLYAAVQLNNGTNPANGGLLDLFASSDAGATWAFLSATPAYTNQAYANNVGSLDQAAYDNVLAVDPADPKHLLAGGIALVESRDGGSTWTNVNGAKFGTGTSRLHPDFHALVFTSTGTVLLGSDGGVHTYDPLKNGVGDLNTNLNTAQYWMDLSIYNNGAQVLGGMQDNGTALLNGAGPGWPGVVHGDGAYSAINPLDPNEQFATVDNNPSQPLWATSNAWQSTPGPIDKEPPAGAFNFAPPMTIVPNPSVPDSPTIYFGGVDLYVTNNLLATTTTWAKLTSHGGPVSAIAVAPSSPAVLYVGFDDGTVLVSANATAAAPTFTDITPNTGLGRNSFWVTHIGVDPGDPGHIVLTFSNSYTRTSAVAPMVFMGTVSLAGPSATYTDITGNLPTGIASSSIVFNRARLDVATDVGVFETTAANGSSTMWYAPGSSLPNVPVMGLTVGTDGSLFAATHGRGVWKLASPPHATIGDFDGDGKTDLTIFRPGTGEWFTSYSSGGPYGDITWGAPGGSDIPVPADYDGTGRVQQAVYRPSNGTWYIRHAQGYDATVWGVSTDIPVPGDYDGTGKTQIAVYRPSTGEWFILHANGTYDDITWGVSSDVPTPADYDGTGKTQIAIYRPSTGEWFVLHAGGTYADTTWGKAADVPVPGDYDGTGRTQIAVYRPSTGEWFVLHAGGTYTVTTWGVSTDVPQPGDYDGDGKLDIAVYRPGSTGTWYVLAPNGTNYTATGWGTTSDIPTVLPAAVRRAYYQPSAGSCPPPNICGGVR